MLNTSPRCFMKRSEKEEQDPGKQPVQTGETLIRGTLIYDAECRLCVASKQFLEKWDCSHRIQFLPFQEREAREIIPDLAGMTHINAMRFVERDRRVSVGVDAFRRMLPMLPLGRVFSSIFYLPGFPWLAGKIYSVVAKNRYRWFGTCQ